MTTEQESKLNELLRRYLEGLITDHELVNQFVLIMTTKEIT